METDTTGRRAILTAARYHRAQAFDDVVGRLRLAGVVAIRAEDGARRVSRRVQALEYLDRLREILEPSDPCDPAIGRARRAVGFALERLGRRIGGRR